MSRVLALVVAAAATPIPAAALAQAPSAPPQEGTTLAGSAVVLAGHGRRRFAGGGFRGTLRYRASMTVAASATAVPG